MVKRKATQTVNLKIRMKEPLRAAIEKAAKSKNISLNAEAVARLTDSFAEERFIEQWVGQFFGDSFKATVGMMIADAINKAERKTRKDWRKDAQTFELALDHMHRCVSDILPKFFEGNQK